MPALEQSYLDVVDTLLAHGAPVDARVQPGVPRMPMHSSVPEHEGQTALGFAAPECADRLVRHLLRRGAGARALADGAPVLVGAARNGCPKTVALLVEHGADVNADPQGGGTALERLAMVSAFHQGHLEVARLLKVTASRVENGDDHGQLVDENGNHVGEYKFTGRQPRG